MHNIYLLLSQVNIAPLPHVDAGNIQVVHIIYIVLGIIGALSTLFFVAGGLRYITAQGDPGQLSQAKSTIIYSIVGLLVAMSAASIVTFVLGKIG